MWLTPRSGWDRGTMGKDSSVPGEPVCERVCKCVMGWSQPRAQQVTDTKPQGLTLSLGKSVRSRPRDRSCGSGTKPTQNPLLNTDFVGKH